MLYESHTRHYRAARRTRRAHPRRRDHADRPRPARGCPDAQAAKAAVSAGAMPGHGHGSGVSLLPGVRQCARAARPQGRRADAARVHQPLVRIRVLSRPEAGRRHHHHDARRQDRARRVAPSSPVTDSGCSRADTSTVAKTCALAAVREAREEAGIDVRLDGLVGIYSYPGTTAVIIVYRATWLGGELAIDDENSEIRAFDPGDVPWDALAFRSTTRSPARLPARWRRCRARHRRQRGLTASGPTSGCPCVLASGPTRPLRRERDTQADPPRFPAGDDGASTDTSDSATSL